MTQFRKSDASLTSVSPWTRLLRLSALVAVVVAGGQQMAAQSDASAEPGSTTLSILGPELQDYGWTPGMAPTAAEAELEDMSAVRRGYFAVPGVSKGFDFLRGVKWAGRPPSRTWGGAGTPSRAGTWTSAR